ncbi:hypothetical protein K438DRAFT_1965688 [Mycena galopus ATCC 62051]|nr:hypothetical protein K438DRAFT_1965688 [Mycena galopus ATCC 62051]
MDRLMREETMRKLVSKEDPRTSWRASRPENRRRIARSWSTASQSILHTLMQAVSAADQENAGTNANGKHEPSPSGQGTSANSVRPAPGNSNSQPAKPARTATMTPSFAFSKPVPHRGGNDVPHHTNPPLSKRTQDKIVCNGCGSLSAQGISFFLVEARTIYDGNQD